MTAVEVGAERARNGHLSLLHDRPVVLHTVDWELYDPTKAIWTVLEALPRRRSHLLVSPTWAFETELMRLSLSRAVEQVRNRFEHVEVTVLAPTAADVPMVNDLGVAAVHCSHNALVREDLFFPIPGREPVFDAIYDGKWADYKRHPLAAHVGSLALIAYPLPESCSLTYFQEALAAMAHATWFTKPWVDNPRYLTTRDVNNAYNQSRVGLCLSQCEGANYASIQYLFAGLPVVTTRNQGGRDEFLSWSVARWVADDPGAVAAAVAELVRQNVDPGAVRAEALHKVGEHRRRLLTWIQNIITDEENNRRSTRWSTWPVDLPNKLQAWELPVGEVIDRIREPRPTGPYAPTSDDQPRIVLGAEDVARFREQGFLVVERPLITAAEVADIRGLLDELLGRFDELGSDIAYDLGDTKLHRGVQEIPEISWPTRQDPRIGQTAAFARCQELAYQLLGPHAFCNYDHAIYKPPSDADTTVDWHQDLVYAPPGVVKNEVHIWLALQDTNETNGCMHYVPTPAGTGLLAHHSRTRDAHAMVLDDVDTARAVPCPVTAGTATVHLPSTPHATPPNRSDHLRVAWIFHFDDGSG